MRVLLLGVSTRALAESAAADGHDVVAVDYFGDRDQERVADVRTLQRDLGLPSTAAGLREAARLIEADSLVYSAGLENHPDIVEELAEEWVVLGNGHAVLREVRDWRRLREFCREEAVSCPVTLFAGEEERALSGRALKSGRWLSKPVKSGGGHGIRAWDGEPIDESHVVQAELEGRPASVVFVADGVESRVFGLAEQLVGCAEFGAPAFAWSGNILPLGLALSDDGLLLRRVEEMVARLTRRFGLRGVNGVDFVVSRGSDNTLRPHLVEVNPRYSASMELAEAAYGVNVFALHLAALEGRLPAFSMRERLVAGSFGKAIVYARGPVTVGCTDEWMAQGVRDVPSEGQRIEAGHPVCTVFAEGGGREECFDGLRLQAVARYREIEREREKCCG